MLLQINTLENIGRFITVLFLFILVLGLTYFTTRYIANFQKNKIVNGNIKIVETTQIAPNKYIQIISVGTKYFVIAICKDTVTNLGQIDESDLDLSLLSANELPSFSDIISKAKKKLEKKDDE